MVAGVVDHHVQDHLQAVVVEGLHQLGQVGAAALGQVRPAAVQVRIDPLEVHRPVAVVAGAVAQVDDVDVDRRQPDGCHAQGLEVGDLRHQPGEVAAVEVAGIGRLGWLVVAGIAVEEAVGQDEIDHIILGYHLGLLVSLVGYTVLKRKHRAFLHDVLQFCFHSASVPMYTTASRQQSILAGT